MHARTNLASATCCKLSAVLIIAVIIAVAPARADEVANFYKGKTVTLTVSAGAGGGYDTLARTVARFLGPHLPGQPIIVVRNMAGAGGLAAANFLYANAEKDGSHIGLLQNNAAFEPLFGVKAARYDPTQFNWLGTPSVETGLFVVGDAVPINALDDARTRETTVGTAGTNSTPAFHARLFNDVFGLRLKAVSGYPGQTDAFFAIERGELDGYASVLYSALQATRADWLPQKKIRAILYYGPEQRPEFAGVPHAREVARNPDDRQLLDAAFAPLALGRPLVMPPGVPAPRLAAMRKALMETFADPGFIAESKRLALGPNEPHNGERIQAEIQRISATPPGVLDRLRRLNTATQ